MAKEFESETFLVMIVTLAFGLGKIGNRSEVLFTWVEESLKPYFRLLKGIL